MPTHERLPKYSRLRRLWVILASSVLVLAFVAALLHAIGVPAALARHMAARHMKVGAVVSAQRWLARAARLDPRDGRTELMRAACFRRL